MYIDTHCHLSKADYADVSAVIEDARQNKVEKLIVSGCDALSIEESLQFGAQYSNVFLTLGYHPEVASLVKEDQLSDLEYLVRQNKKVVGIGEIGLDYHYGKANRSEQIRLFREQLELAVSLQLPVVIHSRDAVEDTIAILSEYPVRGVIHCFSGSLETAKLYIQMGFKLGIGGVVTFTNAHLKEVVKAIALSDLVLETDSPYLSPAPVRGQKNEPKNIPHIAEMISRLKRISIEEVERVTTQTALSLFDLERKV